MATLLPGSIPVPFLILIFGVLLFFIVAAYGVFSTFIFMQIPNSFAQLKAQITKRGLVMIHYVNNRAKFYCPKRNGKKGQENTLTLPEELGAKFDPSGSGLSEVIDKVTLYHYYSKLSNALKPVYAKAVQDFYTFCNNKGININEELIDVLVVRDLDIKDVYTEPLLDMVMKNLPLPIRTEKEVWLDENLLSVEHDKFKNLLTQLERLDTTELDKNDIADLKEEIARCESNVDFLNGKKEELKELEKFKTELQAVEIDIIDLKKEKSKLIDEIDIITGYLDPETREIIYTLKRLQDDLKKTVITDGLFVFSKVQELAYSVSSLTSSGVTESINIAQSDALEQNRDDNRGMTLVTLAGIIFLGVFLIAGIGIGIKIGFG